MLQPTSVVVTNYVVAAVVDNDSDHDKCTDDKDDTNARSADATRKNRRGTANILVTSTATYLYNICIGRRTDTTRLDDSALLCVSFPYAGRYDVLNSLQLRRYDNDDNDDDDRDNATDDDDDAD